MGTFSLFHYTGRKSYSFSSRPSKAVILAEQVEPIEQGAKERIEDYFNQLYTSLDVVSVEEQKDQIKQTLEKQKETVFRLTNCSFENVFSSRTSDSDKEYNEILSLPEGPIKEEIENDFSSLVFQEGLDKLCEDMKQSVTVVCDKLDEELDHFVADQQKLVNYYAQSLEKMAKIKSSEAGKQRLAEIENEQADLVKRVESVKQQARERIDELEKSIRDLAAEKEASDSES